MDERLYPQCKGGVHSKYDVGVLQLLDENGNVIVSFDPANRRMDIPSGANLRVGGNTLTGTELSVLDAVTIGTKAASKAITLDADRECDSLGDIRVADKLIATGDVLTLFTTPISIVAAVGAANYFQFLGAYVFLDYASIQYVAGVGEDLQFQNLSAGDKVSQTIDGTMFTGAGDNLVIVRPLPANASEINDCVIDGGIEVAVASGNWDSGNSPLKIRVFYRVIRKASLLAIA